MAYRHTPNITAGMTPQQHCTEVLQSRPAYHDPMPNYLAFVLIILILNVMVTITSLIWYYKLRKIDLRLRQRHFGLVVFQSGFCVLVLILGPLRDATGRQNWSCEWYMAMRTWEVGFLTMPINLRYLHAYSEVLVQRRIAKAKLSTMEGGGPPPPVLLDDGHTSIDMNPKFNLDSDGLTPGASAKSSPYGSRRSSYHSEGKSSHAAKVTTTSRDELQALLWRRSKIAITCLLIAFWIPFGIGIGLNFVLYPQMYGWGCYGCQLSFEYITIVIVPWTLAPFTTPAQRELGKLGDPLGVVHELLMAIVVSLPLTYLAMAMLIADPWTGITASGAFNWEWILYVGCQAQWFFAVPYQIHYHYKHRRRVMHDQTVLFEVLRNKHARNVFTQHLILEFCVENVRCWEEIQDFKLACAQSTGTVTSRFRLARSIWTVFCMPGSPFEINTSDVIRDKVRKELHIDDKDNNDGDRIIPTEDVQVNGALFDEYEASVLHMMSDSMTRFVKGDLYKSYMAGVRVVATNTNNEDSSKGVV